MTAEHQVRLGFVLCMAALAAPLGTPTPFVGVAATMTLAIIGLRLVTQTPFRRWFSVFRTSPSPSS